MNVEVGNYVRHRGTLMWGRVEKVVPQHDGTLEIEVAPDPVRYESFDYHRKHDGGLYVPCRVCTDDKPCPVGEERKAWDEKNRWWASYHVDRVLDHRPTDEERKFGRAWAPLGGLG